jgi:hypothetical protein
VRAAFFFAKGMNLVCGPADFFPVLQQHYRFLQLYLFFGGKKVVDVEQNNDRFILFPKAHEEFRLESLEQRGRFRYLFRGKGKDLPDSVDEKTDLFLQGFVPKRLLRSMSGMTVPLTLMTPDRNPGRPGTENTFWVLMISTTLSIGSPKVSSAILKTVNLRIYPILKTSISFPSTSIS